MRESMEVAMKQLTVFTPTFNRKNNLIECYESLKNQTSKDFVWQIVDDGSTDDTLAIVDEFKKENLVEIEYFHKENGGKASALNYGLSRVNTPFWVCLDSDDFLFPDAVEVMIKESNSVKADSNLCGIFCVRSDRSGKPMKAIDVPKNIVYATQEEIRYKYKVPPEYVQVYKSSVISKIRFPEIDGEKFMVLSWMQDQLDTEYKFKVIHHPLMVCEYLADGITKNYYKLMRKNPIGFRMFYAQRVHISKLLKVRFLAALMYNAVYDLSEKREPKREKSLLITITRIPGIIYRRKIIRRGKE